MPDKKLTDQQHDEALEDLKMLWPSATRGDHYSLDSVVRLMEDLGLRHFREFTYSQIKSLCQYVGQTCYSRRLTIRLQDMTFQARVGDMNLPAGPNVQVMTFAIESHDGTRKLICELRFLGETSILTKDELKIDLEGKLYEGSLLGNAAVMHYRSTKKDRRYACIDCGSKRCYMTRSYSNDSGVTSIVDAWKLEGPEGVWKVLDRAWVDLLPARPKKRPLSQLEIWTRWYLLHHQPVKVITPTDPYFGELGDVLTDPSNNRVKGIRVEQEQWGPLGNTSEEVEILAGEIIEILPKREVRDPVFGTISYL
jgi:hypothetical protein